MNVRELIKSRYIFVDGAMGTMLQNAGLALGEKPEIWNLTHADVVKDIHLAYLKAGADIITANTFGCNQFKLGDELERVVRAGVDIAKQAVLEHGHGAVALDIGPLGKLLKPLGDLPYEQAIEQFKRTIEIGVDSGVDLIIIETMNDLYELKSAVIAARECCDLPIFATVVLDDNGRLMTGGDVTATVAMLEGLRVDAIGFNCGMGPDALLKFVCNLTKISSTPMIVSPNAGLPEVIDGRVVYNATPESFSTVMAEMARLGVTILGGCCGTTPAHIEATVNRVRELPFSRVDDKGLTLIASNGRGLVVDRGLAIGERINPTGKPLFKDALRRGDIAYALREGIEEESLGADVLDVNVGLAEIDERSMMLDVVRELQGVVNTPLQIDTTRADVLEATLRMVAGKPIVNSVNGKQHSMDEVLPIVARYGGVVIGLTLDEDGIPDTPIGRVAIAKRIIAEASKYGISKKDIIIDPLTMTVATDKQSGEKTLETVKMLAELGIKTVLGISNISFGMPNREKINQMFLALAVDKGLSCAIINPKAMGLIDTLKGKLNIDTCTSFSEYAFSQIQEERLPKTSNAMELGLYEAIVKGLSKEAERATSKLLDEGCNSLDIIDEHIIRALNTVGDGYEKKELYLPQLLMSADSAKSAFSVLNKAMLNSKEHPTATAPIVLATVHGDIHDIGKNIVKVLLENYGYTVIDLGKDVPPEVVLKATIEHNAPLVGLSALMTTTVVSMEKTIKLLKASCPNVKVVVGGAVLTEEYAKMIGADYYAKDALATVRIAQKIIVG